MSVMSQNSSQLLTKSELASKLNLHPNTVTNLERRGVIAGIHIGTGTVRYDYSEILKNLKAQEPRDRIR